MMKFPTPPFPFPLPYHHEKLCYWTQPLPLWIGTLEAHPDVSFVRVVWWLCHKCSSASCWGVLTSLLMKASANRMPIVEPLNLKERLESPFPKLLSLIIKAISWSSCCDATLLLCSGEDVTVIHWATINVRENVDISDKFWNDDLKKKWKFTLTLEQTVKAQRVIRGMYVCNSVPAANAHGCTAAEGLLYKPWSLVVLTYTARSLHHTP